MKPLTPFFRNLTLRGKTLSVSKTKINWLPWLLFPSVGFTLLLGSLGLGWYIYKVDIARHFANSGQIETALSISETITDPQKKDQLLEDIALSLLKLGQVDEALQIALRINSNFYQARTIEKIVVAYVQKGQLNTAQQVVNLIAEPFYQSQAFIEIINSYGPAGEINQALNLTANIPVAEKKIEAIQGIITQADQMGKLASILDWLEKSGQGGKTGNSMNPLQKDLILQQIALIYSDKGATEKAVSLTWQLANIDQQLKTLSKINWQKTNIPVLDRIGATVPNLPDLRQQDALL